MFGRFLAKGSTSASGTERYIQFISGGRTSHGRTLEDILQYSDEELEMDHEFIQWIFPLPTMSRFNPDAPLIDLTELQKHPIAKEKIALSYHKVRDFWGLGDVIDKGKIRCLNGHNGLRFSRALQSLVYHDQAPLARDLLNKVLNNREDLCPSMHSPGKTLWEHLYDHAVETMQRLK